MADPAYRSPWGKHVGGAARPVGVVPGKQSFVAPWFGGAKKQEIPTTGGYRSVLAFWGGGATKPPQRADYAGPRSFLAFWMGGAALNYVPTPEVPVYPGPPTYPSDLTGGIPHAKHFRQRVVDDEEILEFLRTWVTWQDIE